MDPCLTSATVQSLYTDVVLILTEDPPITLATLFFSLKSHRFLFKSFIFLSEVAETVPKANNNNKS